MKNFGLTSALLFQILVVAIPGVAATEESPAVIEGATLIRNVSVTLSDGTRLATDILLPEGDGPFPTVLWRNPYNKDGVTFGEGQQYVKRGYAVVSQDCRGRFRSEGVWDPFRYEGRDGYETLEWVGKQPWCNGKIGLNGGSYLGFTQCINAPNPSRYLTTMNPIVPWGNTYHDCAYWGGALRLQLAFFWGSSQALVEAGRPVPDFSDGKLFRTLPLSEWDRCVGLRIQYLRDWVAHPTHDDYWKDSEVGDRIEDVRIPALYVGGWYDIFQNGAIDYWNGVRCRSKSPEARKRQHLIMGPWTHAVNPKNGKVGDLCFGEQSHIDLGKLRFDWFAQYLKGEDRGLDNLPPLRIFVMGLNRWRDEQEWPLARTDYRSCYLASDGSAGSTEGGGILTWKKPDADAPPDTFVYDPDDPVPTNGGSIFWSTAGPRDQTKVEQRADVLVYTSEILSETLEVTGPVRLVLYAASTAPDTDFTGKLVDVYPGGNDEGTPYNITDGILRARFRESDTHPTLIEPGKVYRYEINLGYTSNAFLPGHRIRLEVSSSNFPRFDRNPNTGHPFGADDVLVSASQSIYHDLDHPSHLILPVIPNKEK